VGLAACVSPGNDDSTCATAGVVVECLPSAETGTSTPDGGTCVAGAGTYVWKPIFTCQHGACGGAIPGELACTGTNVTLGAPGGYCSVEQAAACSLDETSTLACERGIWVVVQACPPSPYICGVNSSNQVACLGS
jgi:hypothetical protein